MSKVETLDIDEHILGFDYVDAYVGELWFFLSPTRLLIRRAHMKECKPMFDKQIVMNCYAAVQDPVPNNQKMLVVATDLDVYVLISTSVNLLILISLSEMKPKVLHSHMAAVSSLFHVKGEFAISASEDNSLSGWDLSQGTLAFKVPFLYVRPACILASLYVPKTKRLFFASTDLALGIFSSEVIEGLCVTSRESVTLPNLSGSLVKRKKLGDFIEEMDYCSELLVILFSNFSLGLFDTNDAGELVQLIRFPNTNLEYSLPRLVPGLLTFVQLIEDSQGPALHIEFPRKNKDEIEVIANSINIRGTKGRLTEGAVTAKAYRGEAIVSIVTTIKDRKPLVQCVYSPHK